MWAFAELPWGGCIKRQWGFQEQQFSAFSLAIFSDTLEMVPMLLHSDMQSVVSFSVITMHDLEWLFCVKFGFFCRFGWL